MLNIIIDSITNKVEKEITNPSGYFDAEYEQSWFQSKLARDIVKGIDNTEYVSGEMFMSPVLGAIPPRDLSTGCKATLLLLNENVIVRGERFVDNCVPWLLKIGEIKECCITLNHVMNFPDYPWKVRIVNTGKIVANMRELFRAMIDEGNRDVSVRSEI